eukprot:1179435-Prorocentrum_minimum.AAC.4
MSKEVFGGFVAVEDGRRFHERLKTYAGIWCCIHAHPGHIWCADVHFVPYSVYDAYQKIK